MAAAKTAVITGSTGGIGGAVTDVLASQGWKLVLVNRSASKGADQQDALKKAYPDVDVTPISADLSDIQQIRSAASEIISATPKIDALLNISGVLTSSEVKSAQGFEIHYAINVIANYLMTTLLRPALTGSSPDEKSMVVTMSSSAIKGVRSLDLDKLNNPPSLGLFGAYATSKMALTIMCAALADDLLKDNILIRAVDPGATATPMTTGSGDGMPGFLRFLAPLLFSKPDKQAKKIAFAADPASYDGRTGVLVMEGKERPMPKIAQDPELQKALLAKLSSDVG
ncbi:MAG: SDR family NAD(P)-dependent oxidoreductase [Pseudomonadota bacterium]